MVKYTFNKVISKLKQNKHAVSTMWLPMPYRGSRRELIIENNCNNRNITMLDISAPGRAIKTSENTSMHHEVLLSDTNCCSDNTSIHVVETNAKHRVRSTGNITNEFAQSTQIYLEKSGKSETKNSYANYKVGDGIANSTSGILSYQLYKPGNIIRKDGKLVIDGSPITVFQYQWINGYYYDVILPAGTYDVESINLEFRNTMFANKHYLIDTSNANKNIYFMRFVYDSDKDRIQIQCKGVNNTIYSPAQYKPWTSYDMTVNWEVPEHMLIPCIVFNNADFADKIGFSIGSYPPENINPNYLTQPANLFYQFENYYVNNAFYYANGDTGTKIKSKFVPFIYRPLNSYYGENSSVSASSFTSKKKFNTVTRNYGNHLSANYRRFDDAALAYNVAAPGYSIKYIMGFDDTCYL